MIELLFVIVIGSVLTSMAVAGTGTYLSRKGSRDARDAFVYMAIGARAAAIERGAEVTLVVDAGTDRVFTITGNAGNVDTLDVLPWKEFQARVTTTGGSNVRICYNPRGFAKEICSANIQGTEVTFTRGGYSATAVVRSLGQVDPK